MVSEFKLTQKDIAGKVGKSREVVANAVRLLDLPADMKMALRAGKISRTHARALLSFKEEQKQREMYKQILVGNFAVRALEGAAKDYRAAKSAGTVASVSASPRFNDLQNNLSKNLGAPVLIKSGASGGNIVIRFSTLEELNKIAKTILD